MPNELNEGDVANALAEIPTSSDLSVDAEEANVHMSRKVRLPKNLRALFRWALPAFIVPQLAFSVTTYFLAIQAEQIDPAAKVQNVALISGISAIAAMLVQPLIGVLSDRTRTRMGGDDHGSSSAC